MKEKELNKTELNEYIDLKKKLALGLKGDEYKKVLNRYMELKPLALNYIRRREQELRELREK